MKTIAKPQVTYHDENPQRKTDIVRISKSVQDIITARGEVCDVTTPTAANTEFSIKHDMGKKVDEYQLVFGELGGILRASSVSRWSNRIAYFKYSLGQDRIKILVQ